MVQKVALGRLWARGYRSLLDVALEPGQLTVIAGENGTGKTNLYRALRLLSRGAEGRLATTLPRLNRLSRESSHSSGVI